MLTDKELSIVIAEINAISGDLHSLKNDELRTLMMQIEEDIKQSQNEDEALNRHLPKVFALVKETAKRFSVSDLVVTANENDKKLVAQQEYDFIRIDGDKAVYSKKWTAVGEQVDWNMVHYDEQLMGGYLLHNGYAAEMATGEGKTLVSTLPVILNALLHRGVHVMTTNSYLSIRDYEITRPLYMFFGLSVDCIDKYERLDIHRRMAYDCDITYGTNSTFIFDYLYDHLTINPQKCVQRKFHNFAIIDELDSILVDEATTPHIISDSAPIYNGKLYEELNPIVKELVDLGREYYTVSKLRKDASFTTNGIEWLKAKMKMDSLFSLKKQYEVDNFDSLSEDKKIDIYNLLRTQNALHQLLLAHTVYMRDVDYIVESDKIVIVDQYTGRKKSSSRWGHGLHTAIEAKEHTKFRDDSLACATISIKNYYKLYHKVAGMSGTLSQVKDELQEVYGLGVYVVPTHKPIIRKDNPIIIFRSKEDKDKAIITQIKENISKGRPTLVGCNTIRHCEDMCILLDAEEIPYNMLNAKQDKDEAIIISRAGLGNTVTVATNMAGRGTDIKPSIDALENGGLMVIGCDLSDSLRVERQLRGRTGRQGNPGESVFFVSMDEDILEYLSQEELQKIRSFAYSGDFSQNDVVSFFLKAQRKKEIDDKETRSHVAVKDDTIAPFRKEYYNLRNGILFNQSLSESLIKKIVTDINGDINLVVEHVNLMHNTICEFIERTLRNDSQSKTIDIPCSDKRHLFTIEINRSDFRQISYFQSELFRQTILQVYDKHWQRLMNYLLEDLDDYEISLIIKKYKDMQVEINEIIYSRLTQSKVVFGNDSGTIESDSPSCSGRDFHTQYKYEYPMDALCPCKSGKKYKDCHGKRIFSHGRRRR